MGEPTGRRCTKCGDVKPPEEFGQDRSTSDGLTRRCRDCRRQATGRWYEANSETKREAERIRRATSPESVRRANSRWRMAHPEAVRESKRRLYAVARSAVLDHYGRECACCSTAKRLTVDHLNGNGAAHRAEIGTSLYRWLIANGFPEGFQVLCQPCNASKGNGDCCKLDHAAGLECST